MAAKIEISKKLVLINSASSILTKVVQVSFLVWLYQYLLSKVSVEEYSLLPVVMSAMVFLPLITALFTSGVIRYIIEAYAKGDEEKVTQIVSSLFFILLGLGLVILLFGHGLVFWIDKILNIPDGRVGEARVMFLIVVYGFVFDFVTLPLRTGFHIKQRYVFLNILSLLQQLLKIFIIMTLLFSVSISIIWIVVADTASKVIITTVIILISMRMIKCLRVHLSQASLKTAKPILAFGMWSFLGQAANSLKISMDPILLNLYATPLDVTCFHLGSSMRRQSGQLLTLITRNIQPALIAMHAVDKKQQLISTFHRGNKHLQWLFFLIVIPAIIYRNNFMDVYVGVEFRLAATVLGILFLPMTLDLATSMIWRVCQAIGVIKHLTIYGISAQLVNLGLTIYFLKYLSMGAVGSALATCLVNFVGAFAMVLIGVFLLNISIKEWVKKSLAPGVVPAIAGGAAWFMLLLWYGPQSWLGLIVCFAAGSLVYIFTLLIFCLDDRDKRDIGLFIKKIKSILGSQPT